MLSRFGIPKCRALRIQKSFTTPNDFRYMAIGRAFSLMSGGTRNKPMKKCMLLVLLAVLAGCNTVAGLGEDVSGGARNVQNMLN